MTAALSTAPASISGCDASRKETEADAAEGTKSCWLSGWFIYPLLIALVFIARLPALFRPDELNPDESQMLAQAMRFAQDPVPWRSVDSTTSGPLNSWLLLAAHQCGLPLNYTGAHLLAAALLAALVALTYATIRRLAEPLAALAAATVALLFVAVAQENNFTHYSSELLPAVIVAVVMFCFAARLARTRSTIAFDCGSCILIGLLPWTKLQAAPVAATLFLWLAFQTLGDRHARSISWSRRRQRLMACTVAVALPSLGILGLVAWGHALPDFWMSYVVANVSYARGSGGLSLTAKFVALATRWQSRALFGGVLIFALLSLGLFWRRFAACAAPLRNLLILTVAVSGAAVFAVLTPRLSFEHQQLLLFQPLCLTAGAFLAGWLSFTDGTDGKARVSRAASLGAYAACLLVLPVSWLPTAVADGYVNYRLRVLAGRRAGAKVAERIRLLCPDAGSMTVWGWAPGLYVQTQRPPATRHAICHFVIDPTPAREYLRQSFLADLEKERPPIVIDAVADGMMRWLWTSSPRVASFPALDQYLRENYVLAGELQLTDGGEPVRFYLSQDYVRERRLALGQR